MSKISDKLTKRALDAADNHLRSREEEGGTNARANNEIQGIVELLRAHGYDAHIIESTLTELGYDEGLISYHLLTPVKTPDEIIKELEEAGHLVPTPEPLASEIEERSQSAKASINEVLGQTRQGISGTATPPDTSPEDTEGLPEGTLLPEQGSPEE